MELDFIEKLGGVHLLVAGEVGIDEYIWGDTRRISPEAPVPVIEVDSQESKLGLAANVASNIVSLGGRVTLVSVKGLDPDGQQLEGMIHQSGIQRSILIPDSSRPTLKKVRVIAQKQHVVRVDYERSHVLDPKRAKEYTESICDLIPETDGVILQDYGKGIWNSDTVSFIKHAKQCNRPVFVDPSRHSPLSRYSDVTLLTPNIAEAQILCGVNHPSPKTAGQDDDHLLQLAKQILKETQAEHAIITCGPWGMVSLSKKKLKIQRIPTFAREVFDVTGAGDTVVAVLAMMTVCGYPLSRCMEIANAAAGIVVGHIGTATVDQEELEQELERLHQVGLLKR